VGRLDGMVYEDAGIPIGFLPNFNSGLVYPSAGMLQLNGIASLTSFDALKPRFAAYESVVATTLMPTWFGKFIGFVISKRCEDDERAAAEHPNSLLYPTGDSIDLIKGFTESDKFTWNSVVTSDLLLAMRRDRCQQLCQRISSLQSVAVIVDGSTKVRFAYYGSAKSIAAACNLFSVGAYTVGMLTGNHQVFALHLLNGVKRPYQ
jgi:hypothetical protein